METKILELALSLGQGSSLDEAALTVLSGQVASQLEGRLRKGVTPQDCPQAFALAGAWTVLAHYALVQDKVSQFTAGDVTVHHRDAKEQYTALLLQAEQIIRPYVRDEGFCFRGV